jgi:hypothetical protein
MSATRPSVHDERASGPAEANRRGAHRARAKPLSTGLPVLAGVLVVLLVVGGAWVVFGQGGGDRDEGAGLEAAAAPRVTSSITAAAPPRASATVAPSASASAGAQARPSTVTAPRPTKKPAAGPTVNRGVDLVVLNSTSIKGLAKTVSSRIGPSGWTVARTDNSQKKGLVTTKVYFGSAASRATALAMVQDLGYGTAVQDASALRTSEVDGDGLVVVLGNDAA